MMSFEADGESRQGLSRRELLKKGAALGAGALLFGTSTSAREVLTQTVTNQDHETKNAPRITFDFYFSSHESGADKKGLAEKVRGADVFVPEMVGWNEELKHDFENVAKGIESPSDIARKRGLREDPEGGNESPLLGRLRLIYNTNVDIEFFDPPEGNPLVARMDAALQQLGNVFKEQDFGATVREHREHLRIFAETQVERERYILDKIRAYAESAQERAAEDGSHTRSLRMLLAFGSIHTSMSHALSRDAQNVRRTWSHKPYIYGYGSEAIRRLIFNKDVSDDLVVRSVVEVGAFPAFVHALPGDEIQPKTVFMRDVFSKCTEGELRRLFADMQLVFFNPSKSWTIVQKLLKTKGVKTLGGLIANTRK